MPTNCLFSENKVSNNIAVFCNNRGCVILSAPQESNSAEQQFKSDW